MVIASQHLSCAELALDVRASSTPAGTRSAARVSCRSGVNSEIVLRHRRHLATVTSGREIRPEASVFDTITTWTF